MSFDDTNVESLKDRLRAIESELEKRNQHIARLEKNVRELSQRVQEAGETQQSASEISEMEEALKRMVHRVSMILQASKCLFMIHDPQTNEMFADTPAFGFDDAQVKAFRTKVEGTISGECFSESKPIILYDADTDERAIAEGLSGLGIKNGLCVPLEIIRRDEETNKVLERKTIGVLHVFNKRFGNIFIDEDVELLGRMARNTAAIINMAESYKIIIRERDEAVDTIQSLSMGLLMVNKTGRITQMNTSALRIFGLKRDDLLSVKFFDGVIKDETVISLIRRALAEETDIAEEISLPDPLSPEMARVFQLQSALVRAESGDIMGVAAIFNDITEIKNVDKMKTAFVSTVSHELRTPLTSIKGFISTLVQDTEGFYDTETRHEFYTIIDTECDRLRRLIDDLLNVSKIESGKAIAMNLSDFGIPEVVKKVITIQNGSTYKKPEHTITYELDENIPDPIRGDQDKVDQIFHNLIGNALKYSPKGGEVKITGSMMSPELIRFGISDQGLGIPPEYKEEMFKRFSRVDNRDNREINGTGIGLFLVKAFVEQHHGKIWFESEVGKGTTFFFTLPTTQEEEDEDDGTLASKVAG